MDNMSLNVSIVDSAGLAASNNALDYIKTGLVYNISDNSLRFIYDGIVHYICTLDNEQLKGLCNNETTTNDINIDDILRVIAVTQQPALINAVSNTVINKEEIPSGTPIMLNED